MPKNEKISTPRGRRRFLETLISMAPFLASASASAQTPVAPDDYPRVELVYTANVTISPLETVGKTYQGTQRIIPITGGTFQGPRIKGVIIPGGADWNLVRNDGANSVEAYYFLRTDDGVVLKIINKGTFPAMAAGDPAASRPRFTIPVFEAPAGKYEWLNTGAFVGTLKVLPHGVIQIGVFQIV